MRPTLKTATDKLMGLKNAHIRQNLWKKDDNTHFAEEWKENWHFCDVRVSVCFSKFKLRVGGVKFENIGNIQKHGIFTFHKKLQSTYKFAGFHYFSLLAFSMICGLLLYSFQHIYLRGTTLMMSEWHFGSIRLQNR